MKEKFLQATKDILEKNLSILDEPFCSKKIVLVYDNDSNLSEILSDAYIKNLENYKNSDIEIIDFNKIENVILKDKLISLVEDSTVVLVQSTNFRLDDFRIRLTLKNNWVWAIEHNHLSYIKDDQIETYVDSLKYQWAEYEKISDKIKKLCDNWNTMKIISKNWDELILSWGFEDVKKNIWNFDWRIRAWTFPIWECFTEIKDFSFMNWKISVRAFPDMNYQVYFPKVFTIEIKESIITWYSKNSPKAFIELLDKIKNSEDGEVYIRELWFWLNTWITWDKPLSDINAFERISWFHMSLWKKHQIYRKKFHRKIIQRYHIDIFPDVDYIEIDNNLVFKDWKYII